MKQVWLIGVLLFASLLFVGCTSTEVKKADTPAASVESSAQAQQAMTSTPKPKTVEVAKVGESLTNGKLRITLNSAEFMGTIPAENEFLTAEAKEGKTFVVVDVTVENIDKEANAVSSIASFEVKDGEGFAYNMDFGAYTALDQKIDGRIQPGDKLRGKLGFAVPKTAKGLQLIFNFGLVDAAQAKFNLGDAR